MKRLISWIVMLSLPCVVGVACAEDPPVVILKLDDFRPGGRLMSDGWQRTSDFLASRGLKASYGMIGRDIARADRAFCDWVRQQDASGMIEFWNHGYTHSKRNVDGVELAEFRETLKRQRDMLQQTQAAGKQKLGITFRAFGAPYNAINADTAKALSASDELQIWLYGNERHAQSGGFAGTVLPRTINLETPVHQPNFAEFKRQYERVDLGPCIVLQGHPHSWVQFPERFKNFVMIIDFLQQEGCAFMTPSEYVTMSGARDQAAGVR